MDRSIRQNKIVQDRIAGRMASLTDREKEVLELLLAGNSNKAVQNILSISRRTVESHRASILAKFGARNVYRIDM